MAVEVTPRPTFSAGTPRVLFEKTGLSDLSPDGQTFVMIQDAPKSTTTEIHVVQNWFEELKRLVPVN